MRVALRSFAGVSVIGAAIGQATPLLRSVAGWTLACPDRRDVLRPLRSRPRVFFGKQLRVAVSSRSPPPHLPPPQLEV
jgi:hypothetical protein